MTAAALSPTTVTTTNTNNTNSTELSKKNTQQQQIHTNNNSTSNKLPNSTMSAVATAMGKTPDGENRTSICAAPRRMDSTEIPDSIPGSIPSDPNQRIITSDNENNSNSNCNNASSNDLATTTDSHIDSALLAALRDPRERIGLLKLEQVLVDFIQNTSDEFIEVGGPYNSIVISQSNQVMSNSVAFNNVNDHRPQTTFQRCILHRLADRFGIIREAGTWMGNSLRLVRLENSRVPKQLLLNLDPSEYLPPPVDDLSNSVDRMSLSHSSLPTNNNTANSLSVATNNGNGASNGNTTASTSSKSKPRKMKIMKRHSSNDSGSRSVGSNGDSRATPRKGKNFSDKEKAYAEARARIFNQNEGSSSSSLTTPPPPPPPPPPQPAQSSSSVSQSQNNDASSSSSLPPCNVSTSSLEEYNQDESTNDGSSKYLDRRPGSSSPAIVSKATWRNRREEENDPDFQRGGSRMVPVPHPYAMDMYGGYNNGGNAMGGPYGMQQQPFYPSYHVAATAALAPPPASSLSEDNISYYPGQQPSQTKHSAAAQNYHYSSAGGGRGRGGRGGFHNINSRYNNNNNINIYNNNSNNPNNYYAQPPYQRNHHQHHHHHHQPVPPPSGAPEAANVNSLKEFPTLR